MYVAVMKGCARAAKRDYETALATAWHTEAFARTKTLKGLADYLLGERHNGPVAPAALLDKMLTLKAQGVPMEIRRVS